MSVCSRNAEISIWELGYRSYNTEIRKSYNIEIRQQIPEIPAHRKFVSAMCKILGFPAQLKFVSSVCHAHLNAHHPHFNAHKAVMPTIFMLDPTVLMLE